MLDSGIYGISVPIPSVVEVRDPFIQSEGIPLGVEFNHDEDLELGADREVSEAAALAGEN
jgi:hypothetical protein